MHRSTRRYEAPRDLRHTTITIQDDAPLLEHQQRHFDILKVHSQQGGFCLIHGEPGTGKTVLKNRGSKITSSLAQQKMSCDKAQNIKVNKAVFISPKILFHNINQIPCILSA